MSNEKRGKFFNVTKSISCVNLIISLFIYLQFLNTFYNNFYLKKKTIFVTQCKD